MAGMGSRTIITLSVLHVALKELIRSSFVSAFVLVAVANALGADAIVKRQAPLRSEPSTEHAAFMILPGQEDVKLIDPSPTSGYYHVRTSYGEEGWINSSNLEVDQEGTQNDRPSGH